MDFPILFFGLFLQKNVKIVHNGLLRDKLWIFRVKKCIAWTKGPGKVRILSTFRIQFLEDLIGVSYDSL